jgi:hypothetical protein
MVSMGSIVAIQDIVRTQSASHKVMPALDSLFQ